MTGTQPTFAVVIPTFNRADFILGALESVFAQRLQPLEVIVVDDASTDGTQEVLEPLAAAGRIIYRRHAENRERAAARNTGLEVATADFVTFHDSDDVMYPNALESAARYATRHPAAKVFHNLTEVIDRHGRPLRRVRLPAPSIRRPVRAIADGNFMFCIGDYLHRDIYRRVRFDETRALSGSEDWLFWLRVIGEGHPVGRIRRVLHGITAHDGRSMAATDLAVVRARLELVVQKVFDDEELAAVYAPHRRRLEAGTELVLASLAASFGRGREAREHLAAARRHRPAVVATLRYARIMQLASRRRAT